jgi:ABC-three component (ABC-3C) system Middle Component 3
LPTAIPARLAGDAGVITDKARFVGRWLARSGDTVTIFGLLGVEP